jgi:hypothetical protein
MNYPDLCEGIADVLMCGGQTTPMPEWQALFMQGCPVFAAALRIFILHGSDRCGYFCFVSFAHEKGLAHALPAY